MTLRRVMVLLLIPATPLLAQLVNNTVTVTASQSSTAQPDEAVFSVTVASGLDKSLEDAVATVSSFRNYGGEPGGGQQRATRLDIGDGGTSHANIELGVSAGRANGQVERHDCGADCFAEIHLAK